MGADPDRVMSVWTKLKTRVYDSETDYKKLTWEEVFDKYDSDCPNFLTLIDFLLTIPSSSVDAERGFSRIMVKNDWRSRLGDRNLTDLMLLYMESPSIMNFNPEDAIQKWYTSAKRSRRPHHMDDVMNCAEAEVVVEEETNALDEDEDSFEMSLSLRNVQDIQEKGYDNFCELLQN